MRLRRSRPTREQERELFAPIDGTAFFEPLQEDGDPKRHVVRFSYDGSEFYIAPAQQPEPTDAACYWLVGPAKPGPLCGMRTAHGLSDADLIAVASTIVSNVLKTGRAGLSPGPAA